MARKKHGAEQIVALLRQIEVELATAPQPLPVALPLQRSM